MVLPAFEGGAAGIAQGHAPESVAGRVALEAAGSHAQRAGGRFALGRAAREGLAGRGVATWPASSRSISRRIHAERVSSPRYRRDGRGCLRARGAVLQGCCRTAVSYMGVLSYRQAAR